MLAEARIGALDRSTLSHVGADVEDHEPRRHHRVLSSWRRPRDAVEQRVRDDRVADVELLDVAERRDRPTL